MNSCGRFEKSVMPDLFIMREHEGYFEKALNLYKKKSFFDAVLLLLDAISADIRLNYGNKMHDLFRIPQLNTMVNILPDKKGILIKAVFASLPQKNKTAFLATLLEEKFTALTLTPLQLENDNLEFHYYSEYADTNPEKIKIVLGEIGRFIYEYSNQFNQLAPIHFFSEKKAVHFRQLPEREIWPIVVSYVDEAFSAETEKADSVAWYIVLLSIYKITYYCSPRGDSGRLLKEAKVFMQNTESVGEQISYGKAALLKIKKRGQLTFLDDVRQLKTMLPVKEEAALFHLQEPFGEFFSIVQETFEAAEYDNVVRIVTLRLLSILDTQVIPERMYYFIVNALNASSGKIWTEGAAILYRAMDDLCNRYNVLLMADN